MYHLGFNGKLNVEVCKDLLYKGVSYRWKLTSPHNEDKKDDVDKILRDILSVNVGVNLLVKKDDIEQITIPIKKLATKQPEINKTFLQQIRNEAKGESSGAAIKLIESRLQSLIPLDLVGGRRNKHRLISTFLKALKFGKKDVLPLKFFMFGLRIKKVKWMKNLQTEVAKQNVMAKLVLWMWNMMKKMIASKYFVSETQNTYNKLVFIPKPEWQSKTDKAFNMFVHRQVLEPLTASEAEEKARARPKAMLRWLPKGESLRPVISVKGDKFQRDTINAKIFLRQLLLRSYSPINSTKLHKIWTEVYEKHRSHGFTDLFLVSTDISDAYGSIKQDKLISIVEEETRLYLGSKEDVHMDRIFINKKPTLVCRELYLGENRCNNTTARLKVSALLRTIRNTVKSQTIKRQKKAYLIKKGLSQAVSLSAALCNLYLSHMGKTHLAEFSSNPQDTLIRAVDDYLFITPDKCKAQAFLGKMAAGFEDYGLFINRAKSQSNLLGHEEIIYYGYVIHCEKLEVYIKYQGGAVPFRNSMVFTNRLRPQALLEDKMKRIPTYKLNKLTTDRKYMSIEGIARNIFNTACMMGCSFKAVVDTKLVPDDKNHLMAVIDRAANNINHKIKKLTSSAGLGKREIRWIVIRAFLLCLSHGNPRDNNPFPGSLLPGLENMEKMASTLVPFPTKDKLLRECIVDLPPHFKTGH